jgi:glycosyltransferase involved in cell wall biosynthesis
VTDTSAAHPHSSESERLHVVHVIAAYLPATRYGGPTNSVHGLCKALVRLGHRVQVITTDADGDGHSAVPLHTPVALDGVEVTYYRCAGVKRFGWAPGMQLGFATALASADVLHTHSAFQWPTSAAARVAENAGVPHVYAPRGALVPESVRRKSYWQKRAWIELFERRALAHAARLHVTCAAEYRDAQRLGMGLPLPAACVLPNGIDLPGALPEKIGAPAISAAVEESRGEYAVFLGRISWIKGLDRALRALVGTQVRLIVAGTDHEGLRPDLERMAAQLGVAERVRFVGHANDDDKWLLLKRARFLILPSINENFGNVVVEAMSMGCPVIVTPEVGAADVVKQSEGGLVARGEPDALRAAMLELWSDHALRERMAAAGQRYAREQLLWEPIARRMADCYHEIIAERARRRG